MASYKFMVQSAAGPVQAIASGDGSLEILDLDVEYEQAMIEFYGKPSIAYVLVLLWDRLTDVLVFRYAPRYDIMEDLALFISKCPDLVEHGLLPVFAHNDEPMEIYNIFDAVSSMISAAFSGFDEKYCLDITRFIGKIGVHVTIEGRNYDTRLLGGHATLLKEFHYLIINNNSMFGPWARYAKCEYTDIFLFNQKSTEATGDDDPDIDLGQQFGQEHMQLVSKIIGAIGVKDYPADDACTFAGSPPRPCSIGVPGGYGVLYYPLRPHDKTPYSIDRPGPILMEYPDLEEAVDGCRLAREIDEHHGHFYDIRLVKRVSPQYGEDYENWEVMSKKKRQRMGSFADWVAQYWERVL